MSNIININCDDIIQQTNLSKISNKNILITGAGGLIGLHIVNTISRLYQNNTVVCITNNSPDNIFSKFFKNTTLIVEDLTTLIDNKKFNKKYRLYFDIIIHAAGYGQPSKFINNKIKTITLNTEVTKKLFSLLKSDGIFLFCSTSELYSGFDQEQICENNIGTTLPDHPRSCYIESKRCGEAICHTMADQFGIQSKIARISLAYGPGTKKDDTRVLNNIIQKALISKKIELLDDGSSIRTYGYITDIVKMIFNIMLYGKEVVYNISGISKISVLDLANIVGQITNCKVILPKENKSLLGNPKTVNLSLDRYINEFGNPIFVNIENGLKSTILWQKEIYNA